MVICYIYFCTLLGLAFKPHPVGIPHLWFPLTVWDHLLCLNVVVQSLSRVQLINGPLRLVALQLHNLTSLPNKCTDVPSA